ncbi:MAG TPA: 30S ribosomal protein S6 [Thermodesulfobacteriota bacterium]|nr:30S ribosomal protein S6 [Thermodesulfobacteriota bacterium]
MARYELTFIVHPERSDEEARKLAERIGEIVTREGGAVLKVEEWGKRKLAYPIRKQTKGTYLLLHFTGGGRAVAEVERALRLSDDVLRYLTVRLDEREGAAAGAGAATRGTGAPRRPEEGAEERVAAAAQGE